MQSKNEQIKSSTENGYMVINIADNGIGIAPEAKKAIFEKYHRVSKLVEGNGVGLYLVREILQSAGGRIEVESEPGKGSVFSVYLKLDQ